MNVSPRLREMVSFAGCGAAIAVLAALNRNLLLPGGGPVLLLISIGASAVLVFGAPQSPFSSVRAVLGGHALASVVGVCCASWIPFEAIAAGTAVGVSLALMRLLRCVHPPAGSSALLAVVGGESIRVLGFSFVLNPVIFNALVLCLLAAFWRAHRTPSESSEGMVPNRDSKDSSNS